MVPMGVGNGVPVGGKAELDVPAVAVGVVPTDVVVVVLAPVSPDPVGGEGAAVLATVVVGVAALLTGVDIVNCSIFCVNWGYLARRCQHTIIRYVACEKFDVGSPQFS